MDHPMDLALALSQNTQAQRKFESLTEYERQAVMNWANACQTQQEIQKLISDLADR